MQFIHVDVVAGSFESDDKRLFDGASWFHYFCSMFSALLADCFSLSPFLVGSGVIVGYSGEAAIVAGHLEDAVRKIW